MSLTPLQVTNISLFLFIIMISFIMDVISGKYKTIKSGFKHFLISVLYGCFTCGLVFLFTCIIT